MERAARDRLGRDEKGPVQKHLEACPRCSGQLELLTNEPATIALSGSNPSESQQWGDGELPFGAKVGRYLLLQRLGTGGLGEVYKAFDPELDRKVAIKLLKPSMLERSPARLQTMLLREAQAMAKIAHPNVVTVYDVGTLDENRVFIAMELIKGVTLRTWVRDRDPTWREIRDLMVQAGHGLQAAHEAGIIHRDFKPSNLLVDGRARVWVLDFGLARAELRDRSVRTPDSIDVNVEPDSQNSLLLYEPITNVGTVVGTPEYMAPEQFDRSTIDARTDQFAFCVTLYEALYGYRPFPGRQLEALEAAKLAGELLEPPEDSQVPGWLLRAMARGLSPNPGDRYPSMRELLHAMMHDRRSRRRQWTALVATGLGSAALAWSVTALRGVPAAAQLAVDKLVIDARAAAAKSYFVYPPPEEPDHATAYTKVVELERLDGESDEIADAHARELRGEFSSTLIRLGDNYWAASGGKPFAIDYYAAALVFDPDMPRAKERASLTPGELASLRDKADTLDFTQAELQAAETLIILAEPDEQQRLQKISSLLDRVARSRSNVTTSNLERLVAQQRTDSKTVASDSRALEKTPANVEPSTLVRSSGMSEPKAGKLPKESPQTSALATDRSRTNADPKENVVKANPAAAETAARQGKAALQSGNVKEAEALFHQALEHDRNNANALAALSELYFEQGAYQRALQFALRGVRAAPKSARHHLLLGDAYFKVLRYAEARKAYENAKTLGHPSASSRLERLQQTVGAAK